MTITEKLYFMRQLRETFSSIGAIFPTSRYAAAAMASEVARRPGPKRVLEVGAGTGSISAEIVKHIGPKDQLVLCEINSDFVAYLRKRIENEHVFWAARDRITIYDMSVTDIPVTEPFDCIVSAVPFTSLPLEITEAILARYQQILRPGGTLTYIEYAGLRALKSTFASPDTRSSASAINALLDANIEQAQFRRDFVWRNVPPAWIRHLRLSHALPEDALTLAPLEHTHRFGPLASDAIPFLGSIIAIATLLRWARLPLLALAALVAAFFRDPRRPVNTDPNVAYASADGKVLSVERLRDPRFGEGEWLRVAVFLSLLNVHINRSPVAGIVRAIVYEEGGYAPADSSAAEHNQACYTLIEAPWGHAVVAQRTGLVARRIVNYAAVGDLLAQGDRFGLIRFGSRTDVYLPADRWDAAVAPGDTIVAGQTILARLR